MPTSLLAAGLPPALLQGLWRASPAACAATLSRADPTSPPWTPAPHLLLLSKAIRNAVNGHGPRFNIVTMPPRHGKSTLVSKWTPVWFLENWPQKRVMLCGHGADFASHWGREVRNAVADNQEKLTFRLADDSTAASQWTTTDGGGMLTAGVGGSITGWGADLLILDDVVKNSEDAHSFTIREKIWDWFRSTAFTRLNGNKSTVFVVMTRWHEDDVVGRLLSSEFGISEHWNLINLPAIYDEAAAKIGPDPLGRKVGQALWPEGGYNETELALRRHIAGEDEWTSLYQQRPARTSGKGNVYDSFSPVENVHRIDRDINIPLFWSLDFNRDPMCSVIGQYREENTPLTRLTNEKLVTCEVLQEMYIGDCGTRDACAAFIDRTRKYVNMNRGRRVKLEIFGDVSGNHRSTSGDMTDWEIVREFFYRYPEFQVSYHIALDNPAVKSRTNAVNTALKTADGFRRLFVDPGCRELIKDFSEVKWKKDTGGNTMGVIDKSDRKRTHLSDAVGYVIYRKFGLRAIAGEQPGILQ